MNLGLPDADVAGFREVLARLPAIDKVVSYGSLAKGYCRPGSDSDRTLYGQGLTTAEPGDIADALGDLLLPYLIALPIFDHLSHPDPRGHIERVGQVLHEKTTAPKTGGTRPRNLRQAGRKRHDVRQH